MIKLEEGNYYHIFNRGNNRENIFLEDRNYQYFLTLYQKYIVPYIETYAYCLLPNHFHFLIRTKAWEVFRTSQVVNFSRQFSHLFNAYAKSFNKVYRRSGSLFQERFHRKLITTDRHLDQILGYVHVNPQHHGLTNDFRSYPYSSYGIFLLNEPTFLARHEVTSWFGNMKRFEEFHLQVFTGKFFRDLMIEDESPESSTDLTGL